MAIHLAAACYSALQVPGSYGTDSQLIEVDLSYNTIHGSLPVFMATMPKLSALSLQYNYFTGIIPLQYAKRASASFAGKEPLVKIMWPQDKEVNNRKVKVHAKDGNFVETEWKKLVVGNVVRVEKDAFFPADLLLLSSSYEDGVCYVETMNLDGETNLKLKQALEATTELHNNESFRSFKAFIKCEDPNPSLYTFVSSMEYEGKNYPLSFQEILPRDSKLRNTEYIYGVIIFSGHDTKVMQNTTDPPSKRSGIERKMDKIIYFLFSMLVLISLVGSIAFGVKTKDDMPDWWYLKPDDVDDYFDPKKSALAAFLHFVTALILYGYLIPISLYVSIEIVKVAQSMFINKDRKMYYEETDKPAQARTSNLNEESDPLLIQGQLERLLSHGLRVPRLPLKGLSIVCLRFL